MAPNQYTRTTCPPWAFIKCSPKIKFMQGVCVSVNKETGKILNVHNGMLRHSLGGELIFFFPGLYCSLFELYWVSICIFLLSNKCNFLSCSCWITSRREDNQGIQFKARAINCAMKIKGHSYVKSSTTTLIPIKYLVTYNCNKQWMHAL